MKEIVIRRCHENIAMANYKVVVENGSTILIGNGENKKIQLDNIPVKVYAKQGWLRSKYVTIDNSTTELILKYEKTKGWIAPGIGGLTLMILLLPKSIWEDSPMANTISIVGLSIIVAWVIYAFVIRRNNWILIEKRTND